VCFHRDLTDAKLVTDLLIQHAGDYQRHDLPFAICKAPVTIPECVHLRFAAKHNAATFNGLPDGAQKHVITEWLGQEFDSARLHGPDRRGHIAVAGDEDDRHVSPFGGYALLQIETIEARKRKVKYEAARNRRSWPHKEFLRGRE
jgi:hypothetical protein